VSDLSKLNQFRFKKDVEAEDGADGRGQFMDGKNGKDLVLMVPTGTIIHNLDSGFSKEITTVGQRVMSAQGGRGGRGNFQFRSPTNTSPKMAEDGRPGEDYNIRLELKMMADVGLIGLPNAGKSSLLNELTSAKAKIGNYAFTTLEPNLGAYYDLIIADIPGLIEGASEGKGLGVKFLRHIERTKEIFHLISAESEDPVADYKTVRDELEKYSLKLAETPETVFLSKSDEISEERISEIVQEFKKIDVDIIPISIISEERIKPVRDALVKTDTNKKSPLTE
jgi:GTP-binding protein